MEKWKGISDETRVEFICLADNRHHNCKYFYDCYILGTYKLLFYVWLCYDKSRSENGR